MTNRFGRLTKIEKIAVAFLGVLALVTGYQIVHEFTLEHSETFPKKGGLYVEATSGKVDAINPLFIHYGSLTHDLSLLIFSGLTKYDPKTQEIVPDLADFTVSDDGKTYTYVLKDKALWHDGQPITSDDVLFTYQTVLGSPSFKGPILNYNDYSGIKVFKVDSRTVKFALEKPDSFFPVKTIVGLLPEHLLSAVPPENLGQDLFNQAPVGSGPYRFGSMKTEDNMTEITLQAFAGYIGQKPNIDTLQLRIYATPEEALKHQGEVDGLRTVPDDVAENVLDQKHLNLIRYTLPQYVAVFLNNESPILKDKAVRLALQLGTDKNAIAEALGQTRIIDTPLLEIDQRNWVYQYNVGKANGSLFGTPWQLPDYAKASSGGPDSAKDSSATPDSAKTATATDDPKMSQTPPSTNITPGKGAATTQPTPATNDPDNTSAVTYITGPNGGHDWETTDSKVTITGTVPPKTKTLFVNDYELKKYIPGDPSWSYVASQEFGNLKTGRNVFHVYVVDTEGVKKEIDAITIAQGTSLELTDNQLTKAKEENSLAKELPIRTNKEGQELALHLIIPEQPEAYGKIAKMLQAQWAKLGVRLLIEPLPSDTFQQRLSKRDYDLLIFGQNLGYNLDAYPYWHSSQAKQGGYNLSQFKNFVADSLLEKARLQKDLVQRQKTLEDLQKIISEEVPAIFLYSPTYITAFSDKIQNATFDHLATTSDRFANITEWYAEYDRRLKAGTNPFTFLAWILHQL
jgi:ABC-type transport system substrate-binding protein